MKILLIRLSSLGDIVLTEPITRELRRIYPTSQIEYLCKNAFLDIVRAMPAVDKATAYSKSNRFHMNLLKQHYDLVIDLHAKFSTILISLLLRSKRVLRYKKQHLKRRSIVRLHSKIGIESTLDLYFDAVENLARADGIIRQNPVLVPQASLTLPIQHNAKKKLVALFPGANHHTKMLPIKKSIDLISLCDDSCFFLIMGSASETKLGKIITDQCPQRSLNLCGAYSLEQLISAIDQVDLVISNDSGPMHIAAALGKDQIAIFGATHPSLGFAPLNPKSRIVALEPDCQPCSLHGSQSCPLGHFRCMNDIQSKVLYKIVEDILQNQA